MTETLTVKLPAPLAAKLNALVRRSKQRKSVLVREAIERLVEERAAPKGGSVYDLVKDLQGIYDGPRDISTNKKYMRGYGR
jgi:Arc/MetJ-type ribon-helix-helix transcriptional regulator